MAVLDSKIQDKIDELEDLSYEKKQAGDLTEAFRLSEEAWNLYPEPKNNWNEAYNSARYIVEDYMEIGDFENAKKWLNRMIDVNNNLHHNDEQLLFYLGKYFFETGDYQQARSKFKEVVDSAGYRYFDDEAPKYLDFYKHPEKYMS